MPISPYLGQLRAKVGNALLLLPSVSAHVFDDRGRMLLVRQSDSGVWSTPGGLIEPDESPADALMRETWEETGLVVSPDRVAGIYGGAGFVVRYPNGDEAQYVIIAFECGVVGGALRKESEETSDARYFSQSDAAGLKLSAWLWPVLPELYSRGPGAAFQSPRWRPPPPQRSVT